MPEWKPPKPADDWCAKKPFGVSLSASLQPDEGSLDHVVPRSRGRRGHVGKPRLVREESEPAQGRPPPHEAGLKLLAVPRAPKELPVTSLLRNAHGVAEWKLFLNE